MKVTYFGTTTLLFDDGIDQIMFDAHFTRPSLLKYILNLREKSDKTIADELFEKHKIDRLRAAFISHTHHDHVLDAPYVISRSGAMLYGTESAKNIALGAGIQEKNITVFNDGDVFEIGDYRIRIIKSLHSKPTILNNDLGVPVAFPLKQPAKLRNYTEGGSYDFYIEHGDKKILIRPSFNYIDGQLDDIRADIIFLGVAGLAKADKEMCDRFFEETVAKTGAHTVIPVHWDNFFSSLRKPVRGMPVFIENTDRVFFKLAEYCESHGVNCIVQIPRTGIEI